MNIRPVVIELFYSGRRTDTTNINSRLSQFFESAP